MMLIWAKGNADIESKSISNRFALKAAPDHIKPDPDGLRGTLFRLLWGAVKAGDILPTLFKVCDSNRDTKVCCLSTVGKYDKQKHLPSR